MVDWTHWHNEPLLIGALTLACWAYALAVGPWRFRIAPGAPFPGRQAA
ncbi:MAG: cytochrome c oxidase assembly protein, partial [Verrucomicrobia bacterium]